MRFRTSSSPPPHLNPKLQRRLLGYVAVIAVVMIVFQLLPGKHRPPVDPAGNAPVAPDEAAFQVRDSNARPLEPDEFLSFPDPVNPAVQGEGDRVEAVAQRGTAIQPAVLSAVEDNTLGIRQAESAAFFHVLDRVRQFPPEQLARSAEQGLQYLNVMHNPTLYRGKPITIVGEMWKLYEFPASDNDYGLKTLYEAWIMTPDSGNRPYRVVCSSLGANLSVNDATPIPVRVTGYFFKREGYNSQGGLHVAPTILASRLDRYVSANAPPPADDIVPVMLGIVVAIGLILATTLVSFAWNDRRSERRRLPLPQLSQSTTEQLAALDIRSVREQLRDLEERERYGDWYPASGSHERSHEQNGHADRMEAVDLPTPLPPTRLPNAGDPPDTSR